LQYVTGQSVDVADFSYQHQPLLNAAVAAAAAADDDDDVDD